MIIASTQLENSVTVIVAFLFFLFRHRFCVYVDDIVNVVVVINIVTAGIIVVGVITTITFLL